MALDTMEELMQRIDEFQAQDVKRIEWMKVGYKSLLKSTQS